MRQSCKPWQSKEPHDCTSQMQFSEKALLTPRIAESTNATKPTEKAWKQQKTPHLTSLHFTTLHYTTTMKMLENQATHLSHGHHRRCTNSTELSLKSQNSLKLQPQNERGKLRATDRPTKQSMKNVCENRGRKHAGV